MTSRSPSTSRSDRVRPWTLLASMWTVALILTLYCAPDVRAWVAADDAREDSALAGLADDAIAVAERTGIGAVRDRLEDVRARIYRSGEAAPPPRAPAPGPGELAIGPEASPGGGGGSAGAATGGGKKKAGPHVARKVLIIGASSIQLALGVALEAEIVKLGVEVKRFGRAATGLSQPEQLDWFAKLEELLDGFAADTVIVNFGGNDALAIKVGKQWIKWGTDEWDKTYGGRIADLVGRIRARGAQAVVIGMPIMRSAKFSTKMKKLNQVTKDYTEKAGGIYLDQWAFSATSSGAYREEVVLDGKTRLMRDDDGIHYSRWGGIYVARKLVEVMQKVVRFEGKDAKDGKDGKDGKGAKGGHDGKDPKPAAKPDEKGKKTGMFERRTFDSEAVGGAVEYLVWRPAPGADEPARTYPVILMLHGAGGSPEAFASAIGERLTALAGELEVILVAPDGGGHSWWLDAPEKRGSDYETMLAEELLAEVARTLPAGAARGALGYSMGGHGAIGIALRRPGFARTVSSLSGVMDLTRAGSREALRERLGLLARHRARWEAHSVIHLVREHPERARALAWKLGCGTKDLWIDANRALRDELEGLGIAVEYDERDAGHDWAYWGAELPAHVRWHAARLAGA